MTILIRNALYVSSERVQKGDVFIQDGVIKEIGPALNVEADEVIDAEGLHLLPGVIDAHVHFREPGMEWKENLESGSKAAAAGGVTTILDMPNTIPLTIDQGSLEDKKRRALMKSLVNFNFYIGATHENLEELSLVKNICGIKIFMGSSTGSLLVDQPHDLEKIFAQGNKLIAVHAEKQEIIEKSKQELGSSQLQPEDHMRLRPPLAALEAIKMAVALAKKYQRRLHILHVTSKEEVEYLEEHKQEGLITAEVTPQHMFLFGPEVYREHGVFAQVNPPIREREHAEALWRGLKSGVIDFVATDHAPHTLEEKQQEFGKAPSGMPGIETLLPLFLDKVNKGACTLSEVVKWLCEKPALSFGMQNKGFIRQGYDADLVLVDMNTTRVVVNEALHTLCQWSLFNGWHLKGVPVVTLVNGRIIYRDGAFLNGARGKEVIISPPWEKD